ncbi:hypothetical protein NE865_14290 [Phthorimaea operculella]|nr:hypothetical protein NE865_14290 [Phthorimaea operculella]
MKKRLCIVYTPLLSVLFLLSGGVFLLILSEALQPRAVSAEVDLSGLHNVSKVKTVSENEVPHTGKVENDILAGKPEALGSSEMTFAETLSLNSVTTDGIELSNFYPMPWVWDWDKWTLNNASEPAWPDKR